MEYYHYTDKQTFSKVHFDMLMPQCTLFESRIEVKARFAPRAGKPAIRTILVDCYFIDAFKDKHCFEEKHIYLYSKQAKSLVLSIPLNKRIILSNGELGFVYINDNGEKNIVTYHVENPRTVRFIQVERISMSEEEKDLFIQILIDVDKVSESEEEPQPKPYMNNTRHRVLEDYIGALKKEISFLKKGKGRQYKVADGEKLKTAKEGYYYIFELEDELHLSDDAPIRIRTNAGLEAEGSVMLCEDFQIIIVINKDIGDKVLSAYIQVEPWKLLEVQIERINNICPNTHYIANKLISEGPLLALQQDIKYIDKGQDSVKEHVSNDDITIVWGPPGTGKTYAMSEIAMKYVLNGKSVLIVSHSNVSVDGVIKKTADLLYESGNDSMAVNGKVLRYGYVRDDELHKEKYKYVNSFDYTLMHCQNINSKLEELLEEKALLKRNWNENKSKIIDIERTIKDLRNQIHSEERRYVLKANLVATTISKVLMDKVFEDSFYDVVMFDEASMAYVTQIVCAATIARKKFVCVGDFMQLASISQDANAKKVLGKDIFRYLGIVSDDSEVIYNHPWLVMLNEQRRMKPEICKFVNDRIYRRLLENHPSVINKGKEIIELEPFANNVMNIIDIKGTYCAASKNNNNSRYNILSAILSYATAKTAQYEAEKLKDAKKTTGIITPYAAQAKLIRAMIKDDDSEWLAPIKCATVHQFQGSEADIIIFDAVESYPTSHAGVLMTKEMKAVKSLVNVALTRAKNKFINVSNVSFWSGINEKMNQRHNMYCNLVNHMLAENNVISIKGAKLQGLISKLYAGTMMEVFSNQDDCVKELINDIKGAKKKIIVTIPDTKLDDKSIIVFQAIEEMEQKGIEILIKAKEYDGLSDVWKKLSIKDSDADFPIICIDNRIMWYGLPKGLGGFKLGDKNVLNVCPFIARITGKNTIDMISSLCELELIHNWGHMKEKGLCGMKKTGLAAHISKKEGCPNCKSSLAMAKKFNSGYFMRCPEAGCGYSKSLGADYVNNYIFVNNVVCPKDGGEITAKNGIYSVYVRCSCEHNLRLDEI